MMPRFHLKINTIFSWINQIDWNQSSSPFASYKERHQLFVVSRYRNIRSNTCLHLSIVISTIYFPIASITVILSLWNRLLDDIRIDWKGIVCCKWFDLLNRNHLYCIIEKTFWYKLDFKRNIYAIDVI